VRRPDTRGHKAKEIGIAAGVRHLERIADVFGSVADDGALDERIDAFVTSHALGRAHSKCPPGCGTARTVSAQVAMMVDSARAAKKVVAALLG
jgi:hypothetical protein